MNIRNVIGPAAVALMLTACRSDLSKQQPDGSVQNTVSHTEQSSATDENAESIKLPDFSMTDTQGKEVEFLKEVSKHKLTLVDFWASWCGPCRQEMPNVIRIYSEYKDSGLGIIGISLDKDREAWLSAIEKMNMTWVQLSDLQGWDNEAARMYGIQSIPFTLLVDSNGTLVAAGLRGEILNEAIGKYLEVNKASR